jgi:hypothetical protein
MWMSADIWALGMILYELIANGRRRLTPSKCHSSARGYSPEADAARPQFRRDVPVRAQAVLSFVASREEARDSDGATSRSSQQRWCRSLRLARSFTPNR